MGLFVEPLYRLVGDSGLLVEYGDTIAEEINLKVRAMAMSLTRHPPEGVVEVIPTYRSILIPYDSAVTGPEKLRSALEKLENRLEQIELPPAETVRIPVCYGGALGPDIGFVAEHNNLSVDEVIDIHSQPEYLIYMIGFTPGFPYLGGLDDRLVTPRLETPRIKVPAGSVGIANNQTGMYSVESPGGWRLIGRTPLMLFAPARKHPFLYRAGDRLKFVPVSREEFDR
ncbi:MAG TPA: 5-oxoprolinase subunit PxpB, partial [Desulfobacteraceae bacterium]|nr:5-oxoprolinase subunit PxpB [Desulfobacteraceae bacterium]